MEMSLATDSSWNLDNGISQNVIDSNREIIIISTIKALKNQPIHPSSTLISITTIII